MGPWLADGAVGLIRPGLVGACPQRVDLTRLSARNLVLSGESLLNFVFFVFYSVNF